MKRIPLTQGKFALVDDEDYEWLMGWKWFAMKKCRGGGFYAGRTDNQAKLSTILMHRVILELKSGELGDHHDGNGLNNMRSNLRKCTRSQNMMNSCKPKKWRGRKVSSEYKGVRWSPTNKKWRAQIWANGKSKFIAHCSSEKQAAKEYDKKAKELFGEFARLNFR